MISWKASATCGLPAGLFTLCEILQAVFFNRRKKATPIVFELIMSKLISAVVCTHNREQYIENCICSLQNQTLGRDSYEIIVVNNASTDSTSSILERFVAHESIRTVYEPKPDLSIARNRGWREASGKFVAYIDDDAIASERWLEAACWAFEHLSPSPQCLTGPITLSSEEALPEWISEELLSCLGYLYLGREPKIMKYSKQKIIGANCHFTKSVLEKTGGFDESLGRKKTNLLSGEETQLQRMIESTGGVTWYHPDVAVKHFVPMGRTKPEWFYWRYFWGGISDYIQKRIDIKITENEISKSSGFAVQYGEKSRVNRLTCNALDAFGMVSNRNKVIQGRIYWSYVFGWLAGPLYFLLKRKKW